MLITIARKVNISHSATVEKFSAYTIIQRNNHALRFPILSMHIHAKMNAWTYREWEREELGINVESINLRNFFFRCRSWSRLVSTERFMKYETARNKRIFGLWFHFTLLTIRLLTKTLKTSTRSFPIVFWDWWIVLTLRPSGPSSSRAWHSGFLTIYWNYVRQNAQQSTGQLRR